MLSWITIDINYIPFKVITFIFYFLNSYFTAYYVSIPSLCRIINLIFWVSFFGKYEIINSLNESIFCMNASLLLSFFLSLVIFLYLDALSFHIRLPAFFSCVSAF